MTESEKILRLSSYIATLYEYRDQDVVPDVKQKDLDACSISSELLTVQAVPIRGKRYKVAVDINLSISSNVEKWHELPAGNPDDPGYTLWDYEMSYSDWMEQNPEEYIRSGVQPRPEWLKRPKWLFPATMVNVKGADMFLNTLDTRGKEIDFYGFEGDKPSTTAEALIGIAFALETRNSPDDLLLVMMDRLKAEDPKGAEELLRHIKKYRDKTKT